MTVTIIATVTRAGKWSGSRCTAQIPQFTLVDMTSLHHAARVAFDVLDPHADALQVSIGMVDEHSNYLGAVKTRHSDGINITYAE